MEESTVSMDLSYAEFSQQSIQETLDQLHGKASSVLLFTLQWNDLEQHFARIRDSIESRAREVQSIQDSLNVAQESVDSHLREVEAKEKEVQRIKDVLEERFREIEVLQREFGLKQRMDIDDTIREIERVEETATGVDKMRVEVEGKLGEHGEKEERFHGISNAVEHQCREAKGIEKDVKERMGEFEVKKNYYEARTRLKGRRIGVGHSVDTDTRRTRHGHVSDTCPSVSEFFIIIYKSGHGAGAHRTRIGRRRDTAKLLTYRTRRLTRIQLGA